MTATLEPVILNNTAYHVGRSWPKSGTLLEDACPCTKAACGLVAARHPGCDAHHGRQTIRSSHPANRCPAGDAPTGQPTTPANSATL